MRGETFLVEGNPVVKIGKDYIMLNIFRKELYVSNNFNDFVNNIKGKFNFKIKSPKSKVSAKIIFSMTSDCNLACPYCYVRGGEKKEYLSFQTAKKVIDFVLEDKKINKILIQFFGGEPSLNFNEIKKIIDYIEKVKGGRVINYELSTNGVLDDEKIEYFLSLNNLTWIISLDGTKEIHEKQRPLRHKGSSYDSTLKTIKKVISKKRKLKIRTTVTSLNVHLLPKIIEHFAEIGIKLVHFEPFNPMGRGKYLKWLPDPEDYIKNFLQAMIVAKRYKIKITQFGIFDLFNPSPYPCVSDHKYKLVVMPNNKDILFCLGAQEEFGDIVNILKVGEISKGKLEIDKKKLINLPYSFSVESVEQCKNCFIKYICKGICPALNSVRNGSWKIPDEFSCKIRKGIIKGIIYQLYKDYKQKVHKNGY